MESIEQSQKAHIIQSHAQQPDEQISFFKPMAGAQLTPMYPRHVYPTNYITPKQQESEQLVKMRNRKKVKQKRAEKNIKQDFVTEGEKEKYSIENVLVELGEVRIKLLDGATVIMIVIMRVIFL